jgi:hypothetical protein
MGFLKFRKEQLEKNSLLTDDEIITMFELETKNIEFKKMLNDKYPNVDIDKALSLIDQKLSEIQPIGKEKEVPFWLISDLNKHLIIQVVSNYIK